MSFNESIFNKMSDSQWERLSRRLMDENEFTIDNQTINFWNLQLHFMELHPWTLSHLYLNFKENLKFEHNATFIRIANIANHGEYISEEERQDLATELALKLSGLV